MAADQPTTGPTDHPTPLRALVGAANRDGLRHLSPAAQRRAAPLDQRTLELLDLASDLTAGSRELATACLTDDERDRLAPVRSNLLRLLDLPTTATVLQLGAGAGAVTRLLGECCGPVDAVEPDLLLAGACRRRCANLDNVQVFVGGLDRLPAASGAGYDLIVVEQLPRAAAGLLARLRDLLSSTGRMVLVLPADPEPAVIGRLLAGAGLTVEADLVASPGPRATRTLAIAGRPMPAALLDGPGWFAVDPPRPGRVLVAARRGAAAAAIPLWSAHARTTDIDGVRLLAADLTLQSSPDGTGDVVIRQVQRLATPGRIRLNGGALPWPDGPDLAGLLVAAADPRPLLAQWRDLLEQADFLDGAPLGLVPRRLIRTGSGLQQVGPDLRADGWTVDDVLAHGVLDTALATAGPGPLVRAAADRLAGALDLPQDWWIAALEHEVDLLGAVHGLSPETARQLIDTRLAEPAVPPSPLARAARRSVGLARRMRDGLLRRVRKP